LKPSYAFMLMPTDYLTADQKHIAAAVTALQDGLLVAIPTETVYGLAADATSVSAINRLYKVKGRPANHPVIVHIHEPAQLDEWALSVPESARILARRFWPGPLTMVLPRASHVLNEITAGQDTVAIRIPDHPIALELLRGFKKGIAAPSANRFGKLSPTTASDVLAEFKDEVAVVLDGGPCSVGVESTIVDLSTLQPRILRPGMLLKQEIEEALGVPVELVTSSENADIKVPGSLKSHYAPSTPLKIVSCEGLVDCLALLVRANTKFSVLSFSSAANSVIDSSSQAALTWIKASDEPFAYARSLYWMLHQLDLAGGEMIIVEKVPDAPQWAAIRDRLQRAAAQPL
jgi:L-threonylcarbamoyladenylate synthase